ncbi:MAG TPA: hypothetical protein VMS56_07370 [Thermoanaerobaculia bacterium]|nr:hypothetical protein [Thermoanaerobaculia bacterium]
MTMPRSAACLVGAALLLAACGERTEPPVAAAPASETAPADEFLAAISQHCHQAFAGRIIADEPPPAGDDPFTGKPLVMHVRECSDDEVRIPFHVGDDRSRTWILTRTGSGLRLKHDHRHEDGTDDEVTMYGGDTATPGTATRQEFPVDEHSVRMFEEAGLTASVVNVWAMEIEPGRRFLYELARPGHGRLFQVEFDLTTPVPAPPTPWGHPELEGADRPGGS